MKSRRTRGIRSRRRTIINIPTAHLFAGDWWSLHRAVDAKRGTRPSADVMSAFDQVLHANQFCSHFVAVPPAAEVVDYAVFDAAVEPAGGDTANGAL